MRKTIHQLFKKKITTSPKTTTPKILCHFLCLKTTDLLQLLLLDSKILSHGMLFVLQTSKVSTT